MSQSKRSERLDSLMLQLAPDGLKAGKGRSIPLWQTTPVTNLFRRVPSGMLFARVRIKGKLIRRSLKTKGLSVAKLRIAEVREGASRVGNHKFRGYDQRSCTRIAVAVLIRTV